MKQRTPNPRGKVRRYLKEHRLTQLEAARRVGLTQSGLNDIMSGRRRPSLAIAVRIESLTGVPAQWWAATRNRAASHEASR